MGHKSINPNTYTQCNFIEIPEGNHRVQICNVRIKTTKNKKCFEITLKVSGHHGKLWYFLWYNPEEPEKTNRDFALFFESFQIYDYDIKHYKDWIGQQGAVCVKHSFNKLDYTYKAYVYCCLIGIQKDNLPSWKEGPKDRCYEVSNDQIF